MQKLFKQLSITLAALLIALPAFALDLQSAKNEGLVGEGQDGYLSAIVQNADTAALVSEVNATRKKLYLSIAQKNKAPMPDVIVLAVKTARAKLAKGHYYQDDSGKWVKK